MHFGYNCFFDMNGCASNTTATLEAFITEAVGDFEWTLVGQPSYTELHTDTPDGGYIYIQLLDRGYIIAQSRNTTNQLYLDLWTPARADDRTIQLLLVKHFNPTVRNINTRTRLAPMMDFE